MSVPEFAEMTLRGESRAAVWRRNASIRHPEHDSFIEFDQTAVTIILDVDGNLDLVYGCLHRSGDVESLDRMLAVLSEVRDALSVAHAAAGSTPGRCFAQGEWGRCEGLTGHAEPHQLPPPPADYLHDYTAAELEEIVKVPWAGSPV